MRGFAPPPTPGSMLIVLPPRKLENWRRFWGILGYRTPPEGRLKSERYMLQAVGRTNALSELYPKRCEEKRSLDEMPFAVPR